MDARKLSVNLGKRVKSNELVKFESENRSGIVNWYFESQNKPQIEILQTLLDMGCKIVFTIRSGDADRDGKILARV